jgi:hypothetical protein
MINIKDKNLPLSSIAWVLLAGILLSSCGGMRQLQEDLRNSREPGKDKFIVTSDNTEIESKKLTFKSPLFKAQKVVLDNGTEVKVKDIIAYQDDNAFYLRLHQNPYGFAHRMKRGPINMYRAISSETYYDPGGGPRVYNSPGTSMGGRNGSWSSSGSMSRRTVYHYFLEKNNGRTLLDFTPANVETMVSDYQPAMDFINQYKETRKKAKRWSLINTAAVLGGAVLMATSVSSSSDKIKPHGYVGFGLFIGGLVNGIFNKLRKIKNVNNLVLAVDEYNRKRK